jgi:hypothetical protein
MAGTSGENYHGNGNGGFALGYAQPKVAPALCRKRR